jgi:uncharacterized membrane protein (TIGR02234 family)
MSYGQNMQPMAGAAPAGGAAPADNRLPFSLGIGGSALALLGSCLAWTSVSMEGFPGDETVAGIDGDGVFTLITSILAIAAFVTGMVKRNNKIAAFSLVPSLVTLVFAVLNFLDPKRLARSYAEDQVDAEVTSEQLDQFLEGYDFSTAFGLYLVIIGVLAALAGGVMTAMKARSSQ